MRERIVVVDGRREARERKEGSCGQFPLNGKDLSICVRQEPRPSELQKSEETGGEAPEGERVLEKPAKFSIQLVPAGFPLALAWACKRM
ncbi:hypothetical protein L6164_034968 [Bauhinia variegata]|uniref:Uncharacterized protein n=1 Tax=Bauhinia variegata TaxID=167791 RepID=A0ACB9KX56_BAUVA|nr:hypothetical protein L6164_034968 [Bauhinia variegata]